jgi:hypothetical protein
MGTMKVTRKGVTVGLAVAGLAGALAGGAGVAAAATSTPASAPTSAVPVSSAPSAYPGHFGGMYGAAFGENSPIAAAAKYLGLSQADLQAQLQAGKSLADVAKAQGKPVSGLEDAMVAAIKTNLDANSTLTAAQKTAILAVVKGHIDTMVTTAHSPGACTGPMGMGMRGTFSQ